MLTLAELTSRNTQPGRVAWIGLRPSKRAPMEEVLAAEVTSAGLTGDRGRAGKRAVTLIQAEHLPVIASFLGRKVVDPRDLRRNIVISGINLAGAKGRLLHVGTAVLRLSVICAPCSRMEETFGYGGYSAVRSHGGWCAEVVLPGQIALGDRVDIAGQDRA
ncbi:MAG: MOSC domain-containing protein [Pseudomonadota bacterium]